jgi:DNA-binding CsgD family transcriptional regulator
MHSPETFPAIHGDLPEKIVSPWRKMAQWRSRESLIDESATVKVGNFLITVPTSACRTEGEFALSHREKQALFLFSLGLCTRDVAKELGISVSTVDTYRRRIFQKLGTKTMVEAATVATAAALGARMVNCSSNTGHSTSSHRRT